MDEDEYIQILQDLYDSEINAKIEWFWDAKIDVALGDNLNGWRDEETVTTFREAAEWLRDAAIEHFPTSTFAQKYTYPA